MNNSIRTVFIALVCASATAFHSVHRFHTKLIKPTQYNMNDISSPVESVEGVVPSMESSSASDKPPVVQQIKDESTFSLDEPTKNKAVAIASSILGTFLFFFQHSQHVSGVALLNAMQKDSMPLQVRA